MASVPGDVWLADLGLSAKSSPVIVRLSLDRFHAFGIQFHENDNRRVLTWQICRLKASMMTCMPI